MPSKGESGHARRSRLPSFPPSIPSIRSALLPTAFAVLAAALVLYVALPIDATTEAIWYQVIAVGGVALGCCGLWRHRPARRLPWVLTLLGYSGWVLGDALWILDERLFDGSYAVPVEATYLLSYVALGAGTLTFVRSRRSRRDVDALLDASIVTAGVGVVVTVFVVAPVAGDSTLSLPLKLLATAYPLGDLFLLGVIARLVAAAGARTASFRLLTASLVAVLAADTAYNLDLLNSAYTERWKSGAWLLSYLLVGAAACVPSMRALAEPAPVQARVRIGHRRLVALAAGLILPGVTLLADGADGDGVQWEVTGVGSLLLCALVLVRMVGLLRTVSVQADRLAELARYDALTGAPNRRTWDDELARAGRAAREQRTTMSVAILDLDHFKAYNDEHGHQAGDRLLRDAVVAWTAALPPGTLLARYGGEEFTVLLPAMGPEEARLVVLGLRGTTPQGRTFSAGVAACPPGTDPAAAVAAADEALYEAKRRGRDRVVVHGDVVLAAAPDADLPELTMVTQPIVDTRTFGVAGYEALARVAGDQRASIQEAFRRAHADGHGDILELMAVRAAIALPGRTPGHDLFVNVSAPALVSPRFLAGLPERLDGVVVELGEDPGDVPAEDVAVALDVLRSRGARVALDDLGAGAQELARLAVLRPDIVKIDGSLVDGCSRDPGRTAVLRALVTYADDLGLAVCAEGVEDPADLDHLVSLGVSHVQGYLLARPAPGWHETLTRPASLAG
jgi:diguanylate cyclase (GGDEF)-like protein